MADEITVEQLTAIRLGEIRTHLKRIADALELLVERYWNQTRKG
jgi:hypothetical protein